MSNKTQLQLNNETLASILSNVLGLPSQESLKHGAYVWKKYEYTPSGTISVSFISTISTETKVQLSSNDVDLSTLQDDDFITLGLGGTMDAITISSKVYTKYKFLNASGYKRFRILTEDEVYNLNYGYLFDATTNILTLTNLGDSSYALPELNLSSMTVPAITGDFIDFTVSDSPTAYPDGGEQGGYYYEKLDEEIDMDKLAILLGCSNVAVDKFTFTSDTGMGTSINHTLGIEPKLVMVLTTGITSSMKNSNYWKDTVSFEDSGYSVMRYWNNKGVEVFSSSTSVYATSTSKTISFIGGYQNDIKYKAGIEYTLITMA